MACAVLKSDWPEVIANRATRAVIVVFAADPKCSEFGEITCKTAGSKILNGMKEMPRILRSRVLTSREVKPLESEPKGSGAITNE